MVKVCSYSGYPSDSFSKYKTYFEKFNYPLHIFQQWSIEGIVEGRHVLITAPTGSGKSLPAEFALDYFNTYSKKTIYCSPVKALSNQKFYDFTQKYPHISIGLITGDIKTNPDADVLIMTTEILLNKLYQINSNSKQVNSSVSFDMDIENELGCVIFDEIHMINDIDRGHVWENSIMMLPAHIQMIGLSATLSNPDKFAYWLENRGDQPDKGVKEVYLCVKKDRAVPLTHYSYLVATQNIFKAIKDKSVQEEIKSITEKLVLIQDAKGKFSDDNYSKINKVTQLLEKNKVKIRRNYVLNKLAKFLNDNNMLPALCYVFSRKQIEICAKEMNITLFSDDSKEIYEIKRECDHIIRKLPNYNEYLQLPEYVNLMKLLEKGIATHHSGMMPILREIVEILFNKGYIKLLFCTETVAIGLNLPVKTAIFTDVNKHDGHTFRPLLGHEFVQASGRAGRLGIDTVGNVIHLPNIFRDIDKFSYKEMMKGAPQVLQSRFKISYNLLLNLIDIGECDIYKFANKSMVTDDIDAELSVVYKDMQKIINDIEIKEECLTYLKTPGETIEEYLKLIEDKKITVNKKRKACERQIGLITDEYTTIEKDSIKYKEIMELKIKLHSKETEYEVVKTDIERKVNNVILLLKTDGLIYTDNDRDNLLSLTPKGLIASHLKEIHCIIFAKLIECNIITKLNTIQLVAIFSSFTNITVNEDTKTHVPKCNDSVVNTILENIKIEYELYEEKEINDYQINSGCDYNIHFNLIDAVIDWCYSESPETCKEILQSLENEHGIFLGEFVKALLKINNIANEMAKIAELLGNIEFLDSIKKIPELTLKYVVTNQSLYLHF